MKLPPLHVCKRSPIELELLLGSLLFVTFKDFSSSEEIQTYSSRTRNELQETFLINNNARNV